MFWGLREPNSLTTHKDRLLMRALMEWERGLCSGCGHHQSESMDPANDPRNFEGTGRYVADDVWQCFACEAAAEAQKRLSKSLADSESEYLSSSYRLGTHLNHRSPRPILN